jgi:hypothetical protein
MLIEAGQEYEAILVATDPLPSLQSRELYAHMTWDAACARRNIDYELEEEMVQIVR